MLSRPHLCLWGLSHSLRRVSGSVTEQSLNLTVDTTSVVSTLRNHSPPVCKMGVHSEGGPGQWEDQREDLARGRTALSLSKCGRGRHCGWRDSTERGWLLAVMWAWF